MKVLVPVKRVVDYNVKVRVKADGSGEPERILKSVVAPLKKIKRKSTRL